MYRVNLENEQQQIFVYLTETFCKSTPLKLLSTDEIYKELAELRGCYERGEYDVKGTGYKKILLYCV